MNFLNRNTGMASGYNTGPHILQMLRLPPKNSQNYKNAGDKRCHKQHSTRMKQQHE
jgi:hypothetical protein